jgi:hypothetical protein
MKRFSLTRLSISVVMLFGMTTFISSSESYADHLSETLLTVDKSRGEWTLVVIPDTQSYVEEWRGQGFFISEVVDTFEWLAGDVADRMNIKLIQSVGDMGEHHTRQQPAEWDIARFLYQNTTLKRGIPTIPAAGNHEAQRDPDYVFFNNYFDVSEYQLFPWWGGHYRGIENTYQLLTIGKDDYLFLTIEWQPIESGKPDVVEWAQGVIEAHPDRKIILTSHWNKTAAHFPLLTDPYENVVMTLAGHRSEEDYYVTMGRTHNFTQNWQDSGRMNHETGDMQVRFFVFKPMDDEVEWFTYSFVEDYEWTKRGEGISFGTFALDQEDPRLLRGESCTANSECRSDLCRGNGLCK